MADARIQDLTPVEKVLPQDRFVLEQNGEAKNLSGQILIRDLLKALDGHGGIKSWEKTGTDGLVDTYTVTLADGTQTTYTVTNGESGVHYGPDEPSPTQDVWVVTDEQQSDEAFAELDARYPKKSEVPSKTSQLENDSGFITADDVPVPFDDTRVSTEKGWTSSKIARSVAPALTRTVSGEVIAVDDVSPLEHEVKCTVSGVPDLSKVTVSRYGGNLFNVFKFRPRPEQYVVNPDGTITAKTFSVFTNTYLNELIPDSLAGKTVVFNAVTSSRNKKIYLERNKIYIEFGKPTLMTKNFLTDAVVLYGDENGAVISDFKINVVDIPFEPYREPETFTPSPDGTVTGMTSLNPNMTLLTDTPGALLDVEYNADPMTIIDKLTQRVADLESAQAQI